MGNGQWEISMMFICILGYAVGTFFPKLVIPWKLAQGRVAHKTVVEIYLCGAGIFFLGYFFVSFDEYFRIPFWGFWIFNSYREYKRSVKRIETDGGISHREGIPTTKTIKS